MTRLSLHVQQWSDCVLCPYHEFRKKIVLGKGDVPCDVLFIGEAPGESEDVTGKPFMGKAGKLLDRIINRSFGPPEKRKYRIAYNNVVACIPREELGGEKEQPDAEYCEICQPRINEFVEICQPRLIVAVGKVAETWLESLYRDRIKYDEKRTSVITIEHPAAIARMVDAAQPMAIQQCVVRLTTAIHEILEGK